VVLGPVAPGAIIPEVVAWPPPDHVPWPLAIGTWSAKLNAPATMDASAVQVQVSINGRAMPVSGVGSIGGSAYGLIRWDVAVDETLRGADAAVEVTINGVKVDGAARLYGRGSTGWRRTHTRRRRATTTAGRLTAEAPAVDCRSQRPRDRGTTRKPRLAETTVCPEAPTPLTVQW